MNRRHAQVVHRLAEVHVAGLVHVPLCHAPGALHLAANPTTPTHTSRSDPPHVSSDTPLFPLLPILLSPSHRYHLTWRRRWRCGRAWGGGAVGGHDTSPYSQASETIPTADTEANPYDSTIMRLTHHLPTDDCETLKHTDSMYPCEPECREAAELG